MEGLVQTHPYGANCWVLRARISSHLLLGWGSPCTEGHSHEPRLQGVAGQSPHTQHYGVSGYKVRSLS